MRTIYVDESGFTGEDLLSRDQPVFTYATVDLDCTEARKIVSSIFADANAKELKYVRLRRSPRHQDEIVHLVETIASDAIRAATWVAHKEFALMKLIVDLWIEPLAHKRGLNLYKDGAHLGMANMQFCCLEGIWGQDFRRQLLACFQHMMRSRLNFTANFGPDLPTTH